MSLSRHGRLQLYDDILPFHHRGQVLFCKEVSKTEVKTTHAVDVGKADFVAAVKAILLSKDVDASDNISKQNLVWCLQSLNPPNVPNPTSILTNTTHQLHNLVWLNE